MLRVETLLDEVVQRRGSDLLLVAGSPPAVRVDGAVARLTGRCSTAIDVEEVVVPLLPPHAQDSYTRDAASPTRRCASRASAGSASTFIASAAARRRPSACCRRACRGSRELALPPEVDGAVVARPRPGADWRRHRRGQDDDDGGAGRRDQPARRAAHHHRRGSDRVRAHARALRSSSRSRSVRTRPTSRPRCAAPCARRPTCS